MKLSADEVKSAAKIDVDDSASRDAKSYFSGEFFYTFVNTAKDGFFFTLGRPVPRNASLVIAVVREGYRRVEKSLTTADDLYLDLGAIKSYPY